MEAKSFLSNCAEKIDRYLDEFFLQKKEEVSKISPICQKMAEVYLDHLKGGKKARGALTYLGYRLAGGKEEEKIYRASIFPEIIQSFLLIHDDIMDRDLLRRGKPTPEAFYTSLYRQKGFKGDAKHFGLSMALDLGDWGMYLGQEALFASGFEKEKVAKVIELANKVYQEVSLGQALDVFGEVSREFNEDYVLKIHLMKTAGYSVSAPLKFGAILAGKGKEYLDLLDGYGNSVGVAFQLHDDILGLYGEEEKLGKTAGARDIKEGKVTLLIVKALEKATNEDKIFLQRVYGAKKVTKEEVGKLKEIVERTGSLDFSLKKARRLVEEGKKFIPQITSDPELQETLSSLADFMIERNS